MFICFCRRNFSSWFSVFLTLNSRYINVQSNNNSNSSQFLFVSFPLMLRSPCDRSNWAEDKWSFTHTHALTHTHTCTRTHACVHKDLNTNLFFRSNLAQKIWTLQPHLLFLVRFGVTCCCFFWLYIFVFFVRHLHRVYWHLKNIVPFFFLNQLYG